MENPKAGIFILSWFGDRSKPELRERRVAAHAKQLEWARSTGYPITVLAQDYDPDEFQDDVTYIVNHTSIILTPGAGRNILLEEFYYSDLDAAIMCDNDSIYISDNALLEKGISDMVELELTSIRGQAIKRMPELVKEEAKWEDSTLDQRSYYLVQYAVSSIYILSNLRKRGVDEVVYNKAYSEKVDGKIIPGEDTHFAFDLALAGGVYYMPGLVMEEICLAGYGDHDTNEDSTWCNSITEYDKLKMYGDQILYNTFKTDNIVESKQEFEARFMHAALRNRRISYHVEGE